jgi:DNA-binding GntR family transcriptional regulator
MRFQTGEPLQLPPLPPYETALLASLAFFRKQPRHTQALNCLTMYLRQSEARVLGEIRFYARQVNLEPEQLLALIAQDPERAEALLQAHLDSAPSDRLPIAEPTGDLTAPD